MRGVGKICDFWPISRCISVTVRDRLLLITSRNSYTGSRLAPSSMTLNAKIGGFRDFFGDFRLQHNSYSQGGATELSLFDPDREFGICVLTYCEHLNFQLNY